MTAQHCRQVSESLAEHLKSALTVWMPRQRWFAGKNSQLTSLQIEVAVELVDRLADKGPRGLLVVVVTELADGQRDRYQVPLGFRCEGTLAPDVPTLTVFDGLACYDAYGDPELAEAVVELIHRDTDVDGLRLALEPEVSSPERPAGRGDHRNVRVIDSEQSNTSVVYDEREILKVFRRLWLGINPDVELHRALKGVRCEHIAPLLGSIEGELEGRLFSFAMLQEFAANSAEGWSMAQTSVRDFLADDTSRADQAGGNFAEESGRLGRTVANVHNCLARALSVQPLDLQAVMTSMTDRLKSAVAAVPELRQYDETIRAVFAEVGSASQNGETPHAQRLHGDLHLGQALRTPDRWLLIDFEGESNRPLDARTLPDSPLRDVAGMLRSYDYVAGQQLLELPTNSAATERRVREWIRYNRESFLAGYAEERTDPRTERTLLRAYELDKAVYEVMYEAQNRPSWIAIPLRAVRRLTGGDDG